MQTGIDKLATETVDHRKLALDTEGDSRNTRTAGIESSRAIAGILERWEVQLADLRAVDRDVGAFEETAREISTIVEVIGEIAHRTHVLSLNAGLEALRAGDQGTGFVGLAEEIRGLSEDTARRADSIEAILGRFQDSLGRLIDRLRTNIQALDEGRTHVGTVRQRLQVIIDGTEAVSDGVVRLARAFEQQAERMAVLRAQAGVVHQTTTNHARVVGETVTRSRDQMIVGADELRHEARELDRVASDLAARAGDGKGQAA
jgi:methyl-accepting chemotaxis protein